jgi:hypothetical protein
MNEMRLDQLEKRGINPYLATIMVATESRFINEQVRLGILEIDKKPTTIALEKLMDGRVVLAEDESIEG